MKSKGGVMKTKRMRHIEGDSETTGVFPCGNQRVMGRSFTTDEALVTCQGCKTSKAPKPPTAHKNGAEEELVIHVEQEDRTEGQNLAATPTTINLQLFGAKVTVTGTLREVAKVMTLLAGRDKGR